MRGKVRNLMRTVISCWIVMMGMMVTFDTRMLINLWGAGRNERSKCFMNVHFWWLCIFLGMHYMLMASTFGRSNLFSP